jgi:hypothetical protein
LGGGGLLCLVYTLYDGTGLLTAAGVGVGAPGKGNGNPGVAGTILRYNV